MGIEDAIIGGLARLGKNWIEGRKEKAAIKSAGVNYDRKNASNANAKWNDVRKDKAYIMNIYGGEVEQGDQTLNESDWNISERGVSREADRCTDN